MQIALISDIHGNLEALDAVLADINRQTPAAKIVCAGDVVGYGPDPGACIKRLVSRAIPSVMGNHDEMVVGQRNFSRCVYAGIKAAHWTRGMLSADELGILQSFPDILQVTPRVVMCHGTLDDADVYISDELAAETALARLRERSADARVLVCGHTHHAAVYSGESGFQKMESGTEFAIPEEGYCVINPGAVGQSRDGTFLARYAILDTGDGLVRFLGLAYDHANTVGKLRREGLVPAVDLQKPVGLDRYVQAIKRRWARFRYKANSRID